MTNREAISEIARVALSVQELHATPVAGINSIIEILNNITEED